MQNISLPQFIKKNPTRCNNVSKFYYSVFVWSSTCFGRHTAHHQKPTPSLTVSGFSYVEGCWTCSWWTLSGTYSAWQRPPPTRPTTFHAWKTRDCQWSFRLLIMGSVSPETFWASYKYEIIKFWYIVAYCWIFLYEFYYDAQIHEHPISLSFGYIDIANEKIKKCCSTMWIWKWIINICMHCRNNWWLI